MNIEIKGKAYTITFIDLNDLVEFEEKFEGQNINQAMTTMKGTRFLLFCALRKNQQITEKEVGNLIDISNIGKIQEITQSIGGESAGPPAGRKKVVKKKK